MKLARLAAALLVSASGAAHPTSSLAQERTDPPSATPETARDDLLVSLTFVDTALDIESLVARLAHHGVRVVPSGDDIAIVRIAADGPRLVLTSDEPDGRHSERVVVVPSEERERIETVAIVIVNLLRDESAELLALFARPDTVTAEVASSDARDDASPTEAPSTPSTTLTPSDTTTTLTPRDTATTLAPGDTATTLAPGDTATTLTPSDTAPIGDAARPPAPRGPIRLGLAVRGGSVPAGSGVELDLYYGFELGVRITPHLTIGIRDTAIGDIPRRDGLRLDVAPFVELGLPIDGTSLTAYAQLAVRTQLVMPSNADVSFGLAPLGVAGARLALDPLVCVGIEGAIGLVLTSAYHDTFHSLPALSVPLSLGGSLLFFLE